MKSHHHKAIKDKRQTRPFFGPVAHPGNPAAHGGVCYIDTCRCGAVRSTNVNQDQTERGQWTCGEC